jgi:hypothetical protein
MLEAEHISFRHQPVAQVGAPHNEGFSVREYNVLPAGADKSFLLRRRLQVATEYQGNATDQRGQTRNFHTFVFLNSEFYLFQNLSGFNFKI